MRPSALIASVALLTASAGAQCVSFGTFNSVGNVPSTLQPTGTLSEISGLAHSRHNPGVLWVHDDAGHGTNLVALRTDGSLAQRYTISGVTNRDWEDLAIGPGPEVGRDYLYIANTGNNAGTNTVFSLVRVPEPAVPAQPGATVALTGVKSFLFSYPGTAFDCEGVVIDPVDGTPYIFSKELSATASLFRYPLPFDSSVVKTLELVGTINTAFSPITGADISADGSVIYLLSYTAAFSYPRNRGATFLSAFSWPRCLIITGPVVQNEAIAVEPDGLGLYVISEGSGADVKHARGSRPAAGPTFFPGWWCSGTGLGGWAGVPGIGLRRAPVLGVELITIGAFDGAPSAAGFCLLSTNPINFSIAGGTLYVPPEVVIPVTLSATGNATLPLAVLPRAPLLYGVELYAQLLLSDPTASQGVAMSSQLTMRLER